jgi:para-nitrobenzyl esterase
MTYAASIAALLAAACVVSAGVKAAPLSPQLVVDTASGPVQGEVANDVRAFLGIPFAKPPLGDLRFREPQPVGSWQEPLPCVNYAPACYQNATPSGVVSEDCLYLNVWTPLDTAAGDDLPVLVFLHGGAFSAGATNDPLCTSNKHRETKSNKQIPFFLLFFHLFPL